MSEGNTSTEGGALPSLSEEANQKVLGAPVIKVKTKSNVTRLFAVGAAVAGMLFVGFGVLYYVKHRARSAPAMAKADEKADPSKVKNKAVENVSIEKQKADIKKKEQDAQAQAQVDAAKAEAARAAALAKAGGQQPVAGGAAGAPARAASAPPRPPTRRELMLGGDVFAGPVSGSEPTGAGAGAGSGDSSRADPGRAPAAQAAPAGGQVANYASAGQAPASARSDSLEARLRPTVLEASKAGRLGNLDYLLKRGTQIPCALKSGIDTTLPGFTSCSVINDVYSANGATLLVERGATVFGEQKSAVSQGQARVFVLWTRLDNPSGVFAELDSPGADRMGYSGLPGYVDDHFWTRFGGAIMLSMIQDSFAALASRAGDSGTNSGSNVQISNTTGTAQSMSTEALKNTVNIPPTINVPAAEVVTVMVARDVSFESVYKVVR